MICNNYLTDYSLNRIFFKLFTYSNRILFYKVQQLQAYSKKTKFNCQCYQLKLTVISIHLFSIIAPQQPKNPITSISTPAAIHRTVALSMLKLGANDAYVPFDTCNQIPIPRIAQPSSCQQTKQNAIKKK